ncbi:MAG: hypothetical protein FJ026_05870 [Chloroflexi bacterium]|nr:hypothetical protein [Chloroflexota bacterium]
MLTVSTGRLIARLGQLVTEVETACNSGLDYFDRLREFKRFCDKTPALAQIVGQLPQIPYDFNVDWRELPSRWPGGKEGDGMRWDAIRQMVDGGPQRVDSAWLQLPVRTEHEGLQKLTELFVIPIHHVLVDQLNAASSMQYALLRFKRWAE